MMDLADTHNVLEALKQTLEENQQDFVNYDEDIMSSPSGSQYLYAKMEALHNATTIAINALQTAQSLNQLKIHLEEGNQALRQDLCQVCMINTELEDQLDQKDKDLLILQKNLKLAHNKINDLEKQLLVADDRISDGEDYKKKELNMIHEDDHETVSLVSAFGNIALIQSKIEEQSMYDEIIKLRRQVSDLKSTIIRLNAVIQLQEERSRLQEKQEQLKYFDMKQKQKQYVEKEDNDCIIQQKKQEQIAQTLTFSHSKHSLADDINQLETSNQDVRSETSLMARIQILRAQSMPVLHKGENTDLYLMTMIKNKNLKRSKNLKASNKSVLIKSTIKNNNNHNNKWKNDLYGKFSEMTAKTHIYLRENIVRRRIKINNTYSLMHI